MNIKPTIAIIASYFCVMSCDVVRESKLQSTAHTNDYSKEEYSFQYIKKIIIVDASVNGRNKSSFIFDTGAFQSKITKELADELQLKEVYSRENGTAQGISRKLIITSIDSIDLFNASFKSIGAGIISYSPNSYSQCLGEAGIIGSNLIKLANWKIDYQKQLLTFSNKPLAPASAQNLYTSKFKSELLSGVPTIDLIIEGKVIKDVIIDVGYNGGIIIPNRYARHFPVNNTLNVVDQSTSGIFGSNRDELEIKELNVALGGIESTIPVEFTSHNKALIGNDFLEHFTIYINYDDHTISFEQTSTIEIDAPKPFIPGMLNDSLWVVDRANSSLPVSIGDTLETINGLKPTEAFSSHCDYFLNLGSLIDDSITVETTSGTIYRIK